MDKELKLIIQPKEDKWKCRAGQKEYPAIERSWMERNCALAM